MKKSGNEARLRSGEMYRMLGLGLAKIWAVNLHDTADGRLFDKSRIERRVVQYGLVEFVLVVALERRLTNEHLVQEDAERPPVHRAVVLQPVHYLLSTHHVHTPTSVLLLVSHIKSRLDY